MSKFCYTEVLTINIPQKQKLLIQLEILNRRTKFKNKYHDLFHAKKVGFEGEFNFYEALHKKLNRNAIQLYDFRLRVEDSECQIDCLLIFQYECFILEIKNYNGNFKMKNKEWCLMSGKEIDNPINQLQRQKVRLAKFLQEHKINLKINTKLVFINPTFVLYESERDFDTILPGQIDWFISELNKNPDNLSEKHYKIARCINEKNLEKSSYEQSIEYEYSELEKGVTCNKCEEFMQFNLSAARKNMSCLKCGYKEPVEQTVLRSVKEFLILFPDRKINVNEIFVWTGAHFSVKQLRRILNKYGHKQGNARNTFYTFENL